MRIILLVSLLGSCLGCAQQQSEASAVHPAQEVVSHIQAHFVPDRRVARLDVELLPQDNGDLLLRGETTLADGKDSLLRYLTTEGFTLIDSIRKLPAAALGDQTWGLTRVSVANLRSAPGHSQELATQALLGTPLRVLQSQKEWYQVQTPDGYIAWINRGELVRLTATELTNWQQSERVVYRATFGHSYKAAQTTGTPFGELVTGGILERITERGDFTVVRYPDGQQAYIPSSDLISWPEWVSRAQGELVPAAIAQAANLQGVPYLWGGTSVKGMDCSGFTKMIYWANGLIIPRDASQQVHAGESITYSDNLEELQAGDFLFFGRYREDGSPKVTHVGIYLKDGQFIHAGADNGQIQIQNLLPNQPNYAPHRRESLLSARRLTPDGPNVQLAGRHAWY